MNSDIYDDLALERAAKANFGLIFEVDKVLLSRVPVGKSALGTVFLTTKKQLFCYIDGPVKLNLGDVQKIASRMGLRIETYFPPKGRPQYFDEIGREKFRSVFPGRSHIVAGDLTYYRTLAPYSPALLLVREVRDGQINQADSDARTGWRMATKFAYRRIKTS